MPDRNQYGDPLQTGEKGKDMTMTREDTAYLPDLIRGDSKPMYIIKGNLIP